jgi:hypothetical protein
MVKPYYQDKWVTIYNSDCREILPQLDVKVGQDYANNFHKHGWDFPTLVIKKVGILR